jgi:catechol 2,3-dioxygenase-like lactoylglutathione lyase family enzyme
MNHAAIYVLNHESAYEFYVHKLGFDVRTDAPMGPGRRWLTVGPKEQPDLEIILMSIQEGTSFTKESAEQMRTLVRRGTFGFGAFECDNLQATYEELKSKGFEFTKPPTREIYGYAAVFKDDSGNWFSLSERT